MTQRMRILIAVAILIVLIGALLGLEAFRRGSQAAAGEVEGIPIYVDGRLVGGFTPDDLQALEQVNFVDAEEGKTQEGWLLRDVLLVHVKPGSLRPEATITVNSSSRGKSVDLTWAEVDKVENMIMFDLSGRGTLKLVSKLEKLDVRDEWVQDVDEIRVSQ